MRLFLTIAAFVGFLCLAGSAIEAQPGGGKKDKGGKGPSETVDEFVAKLMAFNKAKDGKLTKDELTDKRLHALFDRADTSKAGYVTRAELEALFQREKLEGGGGPGGDKGKGPKGFGPGDKGGGPNDPFGKGGGFKGKGGPQPGVVLTPLFQDILNLSDAQRTKLAELQKDVDAKLDKILTPEQKSQLKEMSTQKGFPPGGGDKKGPPPGGEKKGPPPDDKK
jgi:hypothetical protein